MSDFRSIFNVVQLIDKIRDKLGRFLNSNSSPIPRPNFILGQIRLTHLSRFFVDMAKILENIFLIKESPQKLL